MQTERYSQGTNSPNIEYYLQLNTVYRTTLIHLIKLSYFIYYRVYYLFLKERFSILKKQRIHHRLKIKQGSGHLLRGGGTRRVGGSEGGREGGREGEIETDRYRETDKQ